MKALIIVESIFGNTRHVADRVAESLRGTMDVEICDIADAPRDVPDDVDLLVLGGPTHAFGLSRESTRADAAKRGAGRVPPSGLREWLELPPRLPTGVRVAAFDTRINKPLVPGSAAKAAGRKLRRIGVRLDAAPMSFYVLDVDGPLRQGEDERAAAWAQDLRTSVSA